jgi:pyruvate dehydrogenase E2 component (dihydrolipoamide acetyltransferase)
MAFEFRLPDIGEGVAEGEVVQWFVKEGDAIREDAPLVSVLTDKANVEIPSPKSGRVAKIHAAVGEKVKVGGLLVTIEVEGGAPSTPVAAAAPGPAPPSAPTAPPAATPAAAPSSTPPAAASKSSAPVSNAPGVVLASPFLRRLAAERGIDLATVRGSGPGGRIVESDLGGASAASAKPAPATVALPEAPAARAAAAPVPMATPASTPTATVAGPEVPSGEVRERIPIRGLRRAISDHMTRSTHTAAHFTYVEEIDVSELIAVRDRMAKHVEQQGVRLSYLPFIVKGVIAGLRANPRLNAVMDDAREELVVRSTYHLGIATQTDDGLLVPVLRNADQKSLLQLAKEIQELAERARAGKLSRAELSGGSFTITSLGALGGVLATPILNYPEVGILGVHRIFRRPVYRADGTLGPADLMNLSVSLDHRVVDGYEGAQFLATVKGYLEDPHRLFAEMS